MEFLKQYRIEGEDQDVRCGEKLGCLLRICQWKVQYNVMLVYNNRAS